MLEKLTVADFVPLVGTAFRVIRAGEPSVALVLTSTADLSRRAPEGWRPPFSLFFSGPVSPALPQKTYRLEHDAFDAIEIFIVPRGPKAGLMEYEATFN